MHFDSDNMVSDRIKSGYKRALLLPNIIPRPSTRPVGLIEEVVLHGGLVDRYARSTVESQPFF